MFRAKGYPLGVDCKLQWTDTAAVFEEIIAAMKAANVNVVSIEMPYSYVMVGFPINGQPYWMDAKVEWFDYCFRRLYEEGFVVRVGFDVSTWLGVADWQGSPLNTVPFDANFFRNPQVIEYLDVLVRESAARWKYPNIIWASIVEPDIYTQSNSAFNFDELYPLLQRWAVMQKQANPDCLTDLSLSGFTQMWGVPRAWMAKQLTELDATGMPEFNCVTHAVYIGLDGATENPCDGNYTRFKAAGKKLIAAGCAVASWEGVSWENLTYEERTRHLVDIILSPGFGCGYDLFIVWSWRHPSQPAHFGQWNDLPANMPLKTYMTETNLQYGKSFPTPISPLMSLAWLTSGLAPVLTVGGVVIVQELKRAGVMP